MEKERREGRRTGTFRGEREMMNSLLNCNISLGLRRTDREEEREGD